MSNPVFMFVILPGLFVGMLLFIGIGRRIGLRHPVEEDTPRETGLIETIETSMYALLGLLVAFTFAGAANRFDARRTMTVDEANSIGTAYLRIDLLPADAQPPLRDKFRSYAVARLAVYQSLPDMAASDANAAKAAAMQNEIWRDALAALKDAPPSAGLLLLPSLNEMFDITVTRATMIRTHTPPVVLSTLFVLSLLCSSMIGYGFARKRTFGATFHCVGFALVLTITLYVIIDLDYPRIGLIRLDFADQALIDVIDSMK